MFLPSGTDDTAGLFEWINLKLAVVYFKMVAM